MEFEILDSPYFFEKALQFANINFRYVFCLNNCNQSYLHGSFKKEIAMSDQIHPPENSSTFETLKKLSSASDLPIFTALAYDIKNEIEDLESKNLDEINLPNASFLIPEIYVEINGTKVEIKAAGRDEKVIFKQISELIYSKNAENKIQNLASRFSKEEYIETVKNIKKDIQRGDIYELNFCIEYFVENAELEPVSTFLNLIKISPMPFAAFMKLGKKYLICASPERFLKKKGEKLISQPIKGTAKRSKIESEDQALKLKLELSEKERAENIMIVDLVRNDLSHTAKDGSVVVEELCKVYTFEQVHQMISTVTATQSKTFHFTETIKNCFPMGSMTGAPKVNAMKLIEKYERTKRGLFSGAVGVIYPNQDFDLNVVIRSILFNEEKKYLSFQVGSAITIDAEPEKEWEECEIKIAAIKKVLS